METITSGGPTDIVRFQTAYREHSAVVYGLALGLCGPHHAEAVTEAVFLHLWRHPEDLEASASLRTFLVSTGRRLALGRVRSGSYPAPGGTATRAEEISRALDDLPPLERDAIVIASYGRCSSREAGTVLDAPASTINARIATGLRRLRVALADIPG